MIELEKKLGDQAIHSIVLDGDNLRSTLNKDLGFSEDDREENLRRVSEVAKLLVGNGEVVIVSFITPLDKFREQAKSIIGSADYFEILTSENKSTWTTATGTVYRSTNGGVSYSALSTAGKVLGSQVPNDNFDHYYLDVDISAFGSQAVYIKFQTTTNTTGEGFALYGTTFTAIDHGEYSSNVGVSFTNVTMSGFKILLSARFTGTVRYLVSSYE